MLTEEHSSPPDRGCRPAQPPVPKGGRLHLHVARRWRRAYGYKPEGDGRRQEEGGVLLQVDSHGDPGRVWSTRPVQLWIARRSCVSVTHDIGRTCRGEPQHADATERDILYPTADVSHELGSKSEELPAYVVMGYPSIIRDPGFLGAKHGYVYLTQIETGPNGLVRPPDVDLNREDRRETLLGAMREGYLKRHTADQTVQQQDAITQAAYKLAGPKFLNVFDLARENSTLRESYGGEFGQRCLLARRLVQSGVRFVEVSHNLNFLNGSGWDTHNEGQLNQHCSPGIGQSLSTPIADLE